MNNGKITTRCLCQICLMAGMLMIAGCGGDKGLKKDPFLEKWSTMAETSTGSSPVIRSRGDIYNKYCIGMDTVENEVAEVKKNIITTKRLLPDNRIFLKMNKADIKVVLRALARIVGINIIVGGKNEVKGEVTVDFQDVPWDQAFTNLLRAYKLAYSWNDEILMIKTFEDRKDDLVEKTQEIEFMQIDRLVTCVIPIFYITLKPSGVTAKRDISAKTELHKTPTGDTPLLAPPSDYASTRTDTVTQNYSEFTEILASFLTGRGSVGVETITNSLILQATKDDLMRMLPIIEKLDRPTPQIRIKANIVETTKETARQLGIQWGGVYGRSIGGNSMYVTPGGSGGSTVSPGSAIEGSYTPAYGSTGVGGQGFGVNFPASGLSNAASGTLGLIFGTIGGNLLELQLSALQKDSKLNILSSPSITTLDNQMAFTENGEKVPINTQTVSQGQLTNTVTYVDAVLRLEIKPHVIDDKTLSMKIVVKKDEVDPSRAILGNPYILKKQTETNLNVSNGETIVISGLTKQRTTGSDAGLPGLKDIPILGWLFKSDDKQQKMEEVLIFITSTILPPYQVTAGTPPAATEKPLEKAPPDVQAAPALAITPTQ
ncbi:MAG: type IV pilus secretin PilQ [Deltaproteobacteria bacterium]|nr:type IV pilus secretin PilQ [Deltaproteobacteria bacterium]